MISLAVRKLTPNTIIKLTCYFYKKILPYLSKPSIKRGRPHTFLDHQIISMLIIKEVFNLSEKPSFSQETTSKMYLLSEIFITEQVS